MKRGDADQTHAIVREPWLSASFSPSTPRELCRRTLLGVGALLVAARALGATPADRLVERLRCIETDAAGRLGVAVLDTRDGTMRGWRMHERFPMCSTFKVLAAGLVLHRVGAGLERLDRRVAFDRDDLVPVSPVTSQHANGDGMLMGELCEAAITANDNTAGNLLLASFGGPGAVTRFARSIGDHVSHLGRDEPSLNEARAGDPRDTTAPTSMALNFRALLLGPALDAAGRSQLQAWLLANTTGDHRLRAGLPSDWIVGDKTGTGENGTANDVAIA